MRSESLLLEQVVEQLSGWGVRHVDHDFDGGDRWAAVDFTDGACTDKQARDQAHVLRFAMERAIGSILDLQGIRLEKLDNPQLVMHVDLDSAIFSYRGYEDREEQKLLQRRQLRWPLKESSFVEAIEFVSPTVGQDQASIFEAWRPHPATTLEIKWSNAGRATITANGGTLFYDAIWPELVPEEVALLTKAVAARLPTPPKVHCRSTWQSSLVLDFRQGNLTLLQSEVLCLQDEFCSGVMPIQEMFWLGLSRQADRLSREDHDLWLMNGMLPVEEVSTQLLVDLVGLDSSSEASSNGIGIESPELYEELQIEDDEERRLLTKEIMEDQESLARSEEDGWFYDD